MILAQFSHCLFDLYDKSYTMDLEDFNTACKLPLWGNVSQPRKFEYKDFLASIIVGETREIAQATIGRFHFPAIYYFALFIGRCINGKDEACHMCVLDLTLRLDVCIGPFNWIWYRLAANSVVWMRTETRG